MIFFASHGFRVIAHDRRGHGRSSQVGDGHDMGHYADDLAALTEELDLRHAIHVGHSTGGGEVVRYLARHGGIRAAKAAILSAVPPLMVKTDANPGGLPKTVFDDLQNQLTANRSEFYHNVAAGPFYGFNRPGASASQAIIWNWWRQGMMGGAKAHYDGIVAFSQTDFTEDLKKITVPVLVMHGDDGVGSRALPGFRPAVGSTSQKWSSQDVSGLSARHADDARSDDQRGLAHLFPVLIEIAENLASLPNKVPAAKKGGRPNDLAPVAPVPSRLLFVLRGYERFVGCRRLAEPSRGLCRGAWPCHADQEQRRDLPCRRTSCGMASA